MNYFCIYHGNCADGFSAATIVRRALGKKNVEFYAGFHQQPPPDVTGKDVILVDFSYKRPHLIQMANTANSILILDHHKTAMEEFDNWSCPDNVTAIFDMNRCGAVITWNHYFPDEEMPPVLKHIQDRDLWLFKYRDTRYVQAALFSYEYNFDVWENLLFSDPEQLVLEGESIERKHFKDIQEYLSVATQRMVIAGHDVPVLNAPYFWSSDAGHIMGEGEPFAACYWDKMSHREFSLRSRPDGIDVSAIALKFGGGGHKHAAGFRIPHSELYKLSHGLDNLSFLKNVSLWIKNISFIKVRSS